MLRLSADQLLLINVVVGAAARLQMRCFLVGGVVRDLLLGFSIQDKDLDIIVEGDAAAVASECQRLLGGEVQRFDRFRTAKLRGPQKISSIAEVDFASVRTEKYERIGALPIVEPARSIEEDLARRDFTMNAIALPLSELLVAAEPGAIDTQRCAEIAIDRFGGIPDLQARVLRTLHAQSFSDDPTRLFRAARYAARLSGSLHPDTRRDLSRAVAEGVLGHVSRFRTFVELKKLAGEIRWLEALQMLLSWGILPGLWGESECEVKQAVEGWTALKARLSKSGLDLWERIYGEHVCIALAVLLSPSDPALRKSLWNDIQISKGDRRRYELGAQQFHGQQAAGVASPAPDLTGLLLEAASCLAPFTAEQLQEYVARLSELTRGLRRNGDDA